MNKRLANFIAASGGEQIHSNAPCDLLCALECGKCLERCKNYSPDHSGVGVYAGVDEIRRGICCGEIIVLTATSSNFITHNGNRLFHLHSIVQA